jgi:hypothetical protein
MDSKERTPQRSASLITEVNDVIATINPEELEQSPLNAANLHTSLSTLHDRLLEAMSTTNSGSEYHVLDNKIMEVKAALAFLDHIIERA